MRVRVGPLGGMVIVLAALATVGCAGTQPCMVIPMQLELARSERDQVLTLLNEKQMEVDRMRQNVELSQTRLAQMKEEVEATQKAIAEIEAGDPVEGGKQ